jgi:hypothetical protein
LPVTWKTEVLNKSEKTVISRTLCRYRKSQKTLLISKGTHADKQTRHEKPQFKRADRHPEFLEAKNVYPAEIHGFYAQKLMAGFKRAGYRLGRISPRPYRRELIKNSWVVDVETQKVERSSVAVAKLVTRRNPITGETERVYVDEVNSVANAWHYLPSNEVVRLLEYVRRDATATLTACEKRWLDLSQSPGKRAIMPMRTLRGD